MREYEPARAATSAGGLDIDGASKGEPDKLKQGFHEEARMFGSVGGQRYDVPIAR